MKALSVVMCGLVLALGVPSAFGFTYAGTVWSPGDTRSQTAETYPATSPHRTGWGTSGSATQLASPSVSAPSEAQPLFAPPPVEGHTWSEDSDALHFFETSGFEPYTWQIMPDGLIYRSYMAGVREPRFAAQWMHERDWGWMWDVALGGRMGLLRYGTQDIYRPKGFQIDIEGAGMPRLDLEHENDVIAVDFRVGVPITFGNEQWQTKVAYYHLSSHLGDEYMLRYPGARRINFSRDVLVLGQSWYAWEGLRLYAELGWAFATDGGSEPWELQFGVDYTTAVPGNYRGAPFVALNGHLREEVDFGGNFVVQTGWLWLSPAGHMFRMGMQYFAGQSEQYEFFDEHEEKLGLALWYDF